jgi:hypothetical protein
MVAGLNAQLRTVQHDCLKCTLLPVLDWLGTHANPQLSSKGLRVDLAWFQPSTSQHFQLGLVVSATSDFLEPSSPLDKGIDFAARKKRCAPYFSYILPQLPSENVSLMLRICAQNK